MGHTDMAIPPQTPARIPNQPPADANAALHASATCIAALRASEGQANGGGYYNDPANNCTVGTGVFVHYGSCTAEELARPAPGQANEATFMGRVSGAEAVVRLQVPDRALTQDQFDSLVSAAFNLGAGGVAPVTNRANQTDDAGVVRELRARVNVFAHDAHGGRIGPPRRVQGW